MAIMTCSEHILKQAMSGWVRRKSFTAVHSPLLGEGLSRGLVTLAFFLLVTAVLFLSNVSGLYWGRLLNFFSNSSSSFPKLLQIKKFKIKKHNHASHAN